MRYVDTPFVERGWLLNHEADVSLGHPEFIVASLDAGLPLVMLTGLHSGCLELWVGPGIDTIGQLRGKRIAVRRTDTSDQFYAWFATVLGYVGIDPLKDVQFIAAGTNPAMTSAFVEGRADALLAAAQQGPADGRNHGGKRAADRWCQWDTVMYDLAAELTKRMREGRY